MAHSREIGRTGRAAALGLAVVVALASAATWANEPHAAPSEATAAAPDTAGAFDEAVSRLTDGLLAKVAPPASGRAALVIDPLIDRDSGAETTSARSIRAAIEARVRAHHPQIELRSFSTASLADRPYIILGSIAPVARVGSQEPPAGRPQVYRIWAVLAELDSGRVLAREHAWVRAEGRDSPSAPDISAKAPDTLASIATPQDVHAGTSSRPKTAEPPRGAAKTDLGGEDQTSGLSGADNAAASNPERARAPTAETAPNQSANPAQAATAQDAEAPSNLSALRTDATPKRATDTDIETEDTPTEAASQSNATIRQKQASAAAGDAAAALALGSIYDEGKGVRQDPAIALGWYRLAAVLGDSGAMFNVASMYDNGRGIPPDHAEAARWYERAAAKGVAQAEYRLALLYQGGQGVPRDPARATELLQSAAAHGIAEARARLATLAPPGPPPAPAVAKDASAASVSAPVGRDAKPRPSGGCRDVLIATQLEEEISDADRAYFRQGCRPGG